MARFAALDGLRGICALGVAVYHMPVAFHLFGSPLIREAYIFVDFFFVLSGFVIAHAYGSRLATGAELGSFLIRRVGRLWPLHIVTLGAVIMMQTCVHVLTRAGFELWPTFSGETSPDLLLTNALMLHAWGLGVPLSWNVPSWSISAELLASIVFGLVMLLAGRRAATVAALIAALAWFASLLIAVDLLLYSALPGLRAISGFFAGVLVYAVFTRAARPDWSFRLGTTLEMTAVLLVIGYMSTFSRLEHTPWAMPVFAASIYVFAAERGALSRALKAAPLQLVGTLSFSIYLVHAPMITVSKLVAMLIGGHTTPAKDLFTAAVDRDIQWHLIDFGNAWLNDLYALALVGAIIGISVLTYRFIEVPGQRLFAGLAARRFTRPATAS